MTEPAVIAVTESTHWPGVGGAGREHGLVENIDIGDRLNNSQRNGQDTGPLIDFAASSLTVVGELLEARDSLGD